jgi:hypothetical protein
MPFVQNITQRLPAPEKIFGKFGRQVPVLLVNENGEAMAGKGQILAKIP